jgi:hypothetical protein
MPEFSQPEGVEAQFSRLIEELVSANLHRARFQPWEIEILLDIDSCDLAGASRRRILREYEAAVVRYFKGGARLPFKLSAYLDSLKTQEGTAERKPRKPPATQARSQKSRRDHR